MAPGDGRRLPPENATLPIGGTSRLHVVARLAVVSVVLAIGVVGISWPILSHPTYAFWVGGDVPETPWMPLLRNGPPAFPPVAAGDGAYWAIMGCGDTLRSIWTVAWWSHAILHPPASWYDANILFPLPDAITYADLQLGAVPWFAPTFWLTGNPVLAYQLGFILSAVACGLLTFELVRRWTGGVAAGVVAGLAAAAAPFRLSHLNLLYLFAIPYLPAALLAIDAFIAGRRRLLAAVVLATAVVLQSSSSAYCVFTCFLMLPAYAVVAAFADRRAKGFGITAALAGVLGAAAVVIALMYRPFMVHMESGLFPQAAGGGAAVKDMPLLLVWLFPGNNLSYHFVWGLGVPLLLLAVLGLFHAGSRRRVACLALVALGTCIALGPKVIVQELWIPNPIWMVLGWAVPGFAAQRHPFVSTTMIGLGVSCLAGLGTAWILERVRRPALQAVVGAAVLGVVVWSARTTLARPTLVAAATGAATPAPYTWLAAHGNGEPLLELPITPPLNAVYTYFSTVHFLPMFNGTYSIVPAGYLDRTAAAAGVLDPATADAFLREVPVRWILVHTSLLDRKTRARLEAPLPHLERVQEFPDAILFRVPER